MTPSWLDSDPAGEFKEYEIQSRHLGGHIAWIQVHILSELLAGRF